MSSSSSSAASRNVVSPVPPRRNTAVSTVHPLTLLPSYTAPVCTRSSVSKKEIINALNGKTKTRDGAFSCSKKTLKDSLVPIIEKQDRFFKYLAQIDEESASDTSSSASSLKASFAIEFPYTLDTKGKMKFSFIKSSLTHLNKQEIATKIVNTYKIYELAKKSRHFRRVEQFSKNLDDLINETIEHITEQKSEESETDVLRGEKRSQNQLGRKFLQGGGFLPEDDCYRICVFCKHPFIDEPIENKKVFENNRKKEEEIEDLKRQLEEFKDGKRNSPPTGPNGRAITNPSQLPCIKREDIVYHCHCFQMRCATEGTDIGSQCELKCCNPTTGKRYEWKKENGLKKCTCPVCLCNCRKAYKFGKICAIMAELAKEDVNSSINRANSVADEKKKRQIEAQRFIADCVDIGKKSRGVYNLAMDKMKNEGENN